MSRIGNMVINIPTGVDVAVEGKAVTVSGSKGTLRMELRREVSAKVSDGKVLVSRINDERVARSMHGLTRALLANMVKGVSEGWSKNLEMVGVGYRAQGGGDALTLNVGYSHPVVVKAPEGINFAVSDNTKVAVSGIDRELVGQVAAKVRAVKVPEVYKGKGIRYAGEYVRRKAGKAGKVTATK